MAIKVISLLLWTYAMVSMVLLWLPLLPLWLVTAPFDRRRVFAHAYATMWANHIHRFSPLWHIIIEGGDHFDPSRAYILTANHQSTADIIVLFALRRQFRWIAKKELFYVPVLGWMMAMTGYVPIRRGDAKSRQRMMSLAAQQLKLGNTVAVFPEGTRSADAQMLPFKLGAFELACTTNMPVLPVVLEGTGVIIRKNAWFSDVTDKIYPVVRVLSPMAPVDFDHCPQRLMVAVRDRMVSERAKIVAEMAQRGGLAVDPRR